MQEKFLDTKQKFLTDTEKTEKIHLLMMIITNFDHAYSKSKSAQLRKDLVNYQVGRILKRLQVEIRTLTS